MFNSKKVKKTTAKKTDFKQGEKNHKFSEIQIEFGKMLIFFLYIVLFFLLFKVKKILNIISIYFIKIFELWKNFLSEEFF
jgi:hypothetical protein